MDHLSVLVELNPGSSNSQSESNSRSASKLQHSIKSYIGITAEVRIVPLSSIERSIGKAKRVIDKRPKS